MATSRYGVLVVCVFLGCGARERPEPTWEACAHLTAPAISECSGIVHSRQYPGVFWVHNDSGDTPRLFAVDEQGALVREVYVEGAANVDWEDIAADDRGRLYIGDFGNNENKRTDLVIYVVAEPDPYATTPGRADTVSLMQRILFHFPEQRAFPDPHDFNYDCEALFVDAGNLYVLTKHRSDTRTVLYRIVANGDSLRAAQRLGEYDIGSQVTAADLAPGGEQLVVLSYQYIHIFERPEEGNNFLSGPSRRVLIEGRQCEGICFDGAKIVFTNEQREVFCVELESLLKHGRFLPVPPRVTLPRVVAESDGRVVEWPAGGYIGLAREPWLKNARTRAPSLRLGWSASGLLLRLVCPVEGTLDPGERTLAYVMTGPPGAVRPELRAGDRVWEVRLLDGGAQLRALHPPDSRHRTHPVHLRRENGALVVETRIPVADPALLSPGYEIGLNVVLLQPTADGPVEWAWGGSSSTQPEENPLLWGRAELAP